MCGKSTEGSPSSLPLFLTPEEQTKHTGVGVVQVTVSGDLHLFFFSLILKLF